MFCALLKCISYFGLEINDVIRDWRIIFHLKDDSRPSYEGFRMRYEIESIK